MALNLIAPLELLAYTSAACVACETVHTKIQKATYSASMSHRCSSNAAMDGRMDSKVGGAVEGAPTVGTHMLPHRVMSN